MSKPSLRENILNAGLQVMFRSGYQGATVRDICAAAGAPHGSFTNHFRSKEAFAEEVLDRFFLHNKGCVCKALDDTSLTPRQRLMRFLDIISEELKAHEWNRGCLIGDFSLQASPESEPLRHRLKQKTIAASPAESKPMGDSPGFLPWPRPKRNDKSMAALQKPKASLWRALKAHW